MSPYYPLTPSCSRVIEVIEAYLSSLNPETLNPMKVIKAEPRAVVQGTEGGVGGEPVTSSSSELKA